MDPVDIPNFGLRFAHGEQVAIFSIKGELPSDSHGAVEDLLRDLMRKGCKNFVIDLSRAAHVSSRGVGLMSFYQKMIEDRGGKFVLVRPPVFLMEQLSQMKLADWVKIYDSMEAALEAVKPPEAE